LDTIDYSLYTPLQLLFWLSFAQMTSKTLEGSLDSKEQLKVRSFDSLSKTAYMGLFSGVLVDFKHSGLLMAPEAVKGARSGILPTFADKSLRNLLPKFQEFSTSSAQIRGKTEGVCILYNFIYPRR